ncbi:tetratricopeptide repeat protein [Bacteroidota bacterium]
MKKISLVFAILIVHCSLFIVKAQNPEIDSLENLLLQHTKEDTVRVNLLNETADKLYRIDNDQTLQYAKEAGKLADDLNYPKGKAESLLIIGSYYGKKSEYSKSLEYFQKAFIINEEIGYKIGIANCYRRIGIIYYVQGDYSNAMEYFQKSLRCVEELDDKIGIAKCYNNIGVIYITRGDYNKALEYYQKSLVIKKELSDKIGITRCYNNIGNIYRRQGDYSKALEYYQKSLKIKEEIKDKIGIANCYNNIGEIFYNQSDYSKALEYYQKSLKIREEIGDKRGISVSYNNIGEICKDQGNFPQARINYQKSLKLKEEIGDKIGVSECYIGIGEIYRIQGDYIKALEYYQKALKIREESGDKNGIAECLTDIGYTYKEQGDYSKSFECYQRSLKIKEGIGDKIGTSECLNYFGVIFYEMQDYDKALEYYQKSLKIYVELKLKSGISKELNNIALIYEKQNKLDTALDYYDRCITIGEEINYTEVLGWAYNGKGIVLMKKQEYDQALVFFLKGLEKRESINVKKEIAQSCNSIGNLYIKTKQYKKAKEYFLRSYEIAKEIENPLNLKDASRGLAIVFEQAEQYKKSLEYYQLFKQMSDSLINEGNIKKLAGFEISKQYEKEKQAAELEQQKKDALQIEEAKRQKTIRNYFITGFGLMLMLVLVVLRSYIQKRNANRILAKQKKEIEKSYKNVEMLSSVGNEITSTLNLETIINAVYENVNALMDATSFGIGIYDEQKQLIEYKMAMETGVRYKPYTRDMKDKTQLPVWCIENKKEVFINDIETESKNYFPEFKDKIYELEDGNISFIPQSYIYLPLMKKDEVLGIITVQSFNKNAYNENHLNILKNIAVYTSIALENADALQQIEEQNAEIKAQSEELQTANEKLLELDKYKEELTTMIIHDLKNPLNAIIGLSENDVVKQSGKQMLNMIMNILDVNKFENTEIKIQTSNTSIYELSKLALSQVDLLYHQKSIQLINHIQNFYVNIDPEIIERVFINLLTNAIKYTPNNGTITLESEEYKSGFIRIKVSDTGQGIPKEKLHKVFGKFEQVIARKSGLGRSTGIGLTFCKLFVEAHGGEIGVESEEDKGSTFWFTLPAGRQGKEEITIEEETIEDKAIEFTSTEKEILKPFLLRLQELEVYESTEVEKVIEQIDCSKTPNLQKWKAEMDNAMEALNEEKYKKLIHLID